MVDYGQGCAPIAQRFCLHLGDRISFLYLVKENQILLVRRRFSDAYRHRLSDGFVSFRTGHDHVQSRGIRSGISLERKFH